ncbi:MAG: cysteine--tRNA ligase, partial [Bacteroidales bacterium]|nr:cysteine--tRNA ligase [Bacteroidales bacterium]
DPEHIMRWNSPWGEGFPGWHLECSTMSMKYLGEIFDIHGGGMDLLFPHHECEIAQSKIATGHDTVRYWVHNNLITINGQKMGKSLGNSILLSEIFSGNHPLLEQAYHPMTIRFFILQAHYRSTLDFSNEALQASEKGLNRLLKTVAQLDALPVSEQSTIDVTSWVKNCYDALNDDLNTPVMIAHLFDMARLINLVKESRESINAADLDILKRQMHLFLEDILGIKMEQAESGESELLPKVIQLVLDIRQEAKKNRNFELSDQIRNQLGGIGITVKDRKDGADWEIE